MTSYRRILVPILSGSHAEIQLHRVSELLHSADAQLLVLRVIDTRSGCEPDGPAALSPSRRVTEAKRRLDLQLARYNLSWAEARVVAQETDSALREIIQSWQPDLVLVCGGQLPEGTAQGADILTVGRCGILKRFADSLRHSAFRHA